METCKVSVSKTYKYVWKCKKCRKSFLSLKFCAKFNWPFSAQKLNEMKKKGKQKEETEKEMQMIRHLRINRSWYTVINNIKGTQEEGTMLARDKTRKLAMFILVHSVDSEDWSVIKIIIRFFISFSPELS